jgi:hypothetical protein
MSFKMTTVYRLNKSTIIAVPVVKTESSSGRSYGQEVQGGKLNSQVSKSKNKEEAIDLISSLPGMTVELDYDASSDVAELIKLGHPRGVSIIFRTQETILVESLRALQRGLTAEKGTWRERLLCCKFPLTSIPAEIAKTLYSRASQLRDVIVPADVLLSPYEQWKN